MMLALLALGLAGQGAEPAARDPLVEAALERRRIVQELLLGAPEQRLRDLAERWRGAPGGVPALFRPSLDQLADLRALLAPPAQLVDPALQRLVDSLVLELVPGAAPAGAEETTPITVRMRLLQAVSVPDENLLCVLRWRTPEGELQSARNEVIEARLLRGPVEFYVHLPARSEGRWWLEPGLERRGELAFGWPVPLDHVVGLEAAREPDPSTAGGAALAELLRHGRRDPRGRAAAELLAGAEPALAPRYARAGLALDGHELRALVPSEHRLTCLVPALDGEPTDWILAGAGSAAWTPVVEEGGLLLLLTDLPLWSPEGPTVASFCAEWKALDPERPLLLVLRGPQLSALALGRRRGLDYAIDGCVQCSALGEGAEPRAVSASPTLFLELCSRVPAALSLVPGEPELWWRRSLAPPDLGLLELPALLLAWWKGR